MASRLRMLLTVGEIRGEVDRLDRLLEQLPESGAYAIAVVGDLAAPWSGPDVYRSIFKSLGETDLPAFWVPGPTDAPLRDYLRESSNMEIRPRVVVAGGEPAGHELLGRTLVVRPGRFERGEYALVDLGDLSVEAGALPAQATA